MNVNDKNDEFSFGFTTAGGSSIHVSRKALSKAKKLFTSELNETGNYKKSCETENKAEAYESHLPNIGFQTARDQHINVTKNALLKAKTLFHEEISENPETKQVFTDEYRKTDNYKRTYKAVIDTDAFKVQLPNIGFQTASGKSINVNKDALLQAKASFQDELSGNSGVKNHFTDEYKKPDSYENTHKTINKTDAFKVYVLNAGFQTASGQSINVNKDALLKAKALFQEEISETKKFSTDENTRSDHYKRTYNATNKTDVFKVQLPNSGFQTASGQSINVKKDALLKAKALFQEEISENSEAKKLFTNECTEPDNYRKAYKSVNKINAFKVQLPIGGFQTPRSQNTNVRKEALLNAKASFQDDISGNSGVKKLFTDECKKLDSYENTHKTVNETDAFKVYLPNAGFQTASGQSINVNKDALLKAKALFQEEISKNSETKKLFTDEYREPDNYEYTHKTANETDAFKVQLPNAGFQTASGQSINVNKEALLKAKTLLQEEISKNSKTKKFFSDECREPDNYENTHKTANETDAFKVQLPNAGFQTASGQSINVKKEALLKATALFQEEISENSETKKLFTDKYREPDNYVNTHKTVNDTDAFKVQSSNIGFQSANNKCVNVNNSALLKAKLLFQEEISGCSTSNLVLPKSLQKRKIRDVDDNVPVNKQIKTNQFKKLRFSNEFQIPKVVHKSMTNIDEEKNQSMSPISAPILTSSCDTNKLNNNTSKVETSNEGNEITDNCLISHEVLASAVALLADETDSDFSEQWASPKEVKESEETETVPSSPVIGGHFIPKKRKSTGSRKRSTNTIRNKESKSVCTDNLRVLNDKCVHLDQNKDKENKCVIEQQGSTDNEKKCDLSVANEFSDSQLMLDFINQCATILEKRLEAALEQDKQISLKQRDKPKPTIGKLYSHRKSNANNRLSWKEISKGNKPIPCTYEELIERNFPPEIMNITANNAITYKFRCSDFYGEDIVQNNIDGIRMEDESYLILDENGYAGQTEIKRSFLANPGVDPNLLPNGWIENHYKWIIWKLASVDRIKLGSFILPRVLTPARVMMELKYRYDREIDRSQRSALKKILEKDDVATKRMVLCVSSIIEHDDSATVNKSPNFLKTPLKQLVLTDGWYSIQATIDYAMIKNITSGKVKEGTKLLMYGCELLNCDQGYPPLEVPENVSLKIHTNSTRRAKWDMKLGYVVPPGPICIKLRTICPNGGLIGKIKVTIARVYLMLYHEKNSAGESVFRNTRCEEMASIAYEKERRSLIEAFYAKVEKYLYAKKSKSNPDTDGIDLPAIEWNEDYKKLSEEQFLSQQEMEQLKNNCHMKEEMFRQKLESRLRESLPPPRRVTPVLRVRVVEEETSAILSIWSPSEDVTDILKEGNHISICNVMSSPKRGNELQLSANRNALFEEINVSDTVFSQRTYTALWDINKPTFAPIYGEFDTVGIVASIGNKPYGMKNFQAAHLACPCADSQSSYLSILFWNGISFHGYAGILTVGSLVACSNLEWRRATSWNIPMAYCTERTTFTRNPRQNYLQQPFEDIRCSITDVSAYINTCAAEIAEEIQKRSLTRISDQYTPDKNSSDKIVPNENYNLNKQFNNQVVQEYSGEILMGSQPAKSVAIQKRIEKLQCYGEASSLSPIVLNNSSKRVSLEFQSPLRSTNEKHTKPYMSLNRKLYKISDDSVNL